jgi:hypothetical protein
MIRTSRTEQCRLRAIAHARRSKETMKKISIFLMLLLIMVGCSESEYTQVQEKDLCDVFIMNSSPTFQGYYYEGSDPEFHYFTSRWKYDGNRKVKIARTDLEIADEFAFGSDVIGLTVLNVPNSGAIFCEIKGRPVYKKIMKE